MAVYAKVASGLRRSLGSTAGFRRRKPEGLAIAIRQEAEEDSGSEDEGGPDSPDTPAAAAGSLGGTAVEEPDTPDTPNPAAAFPIAAANAGQGAPNIPSAVGTSEAAPLPAATLAPLPVQPAATGPPAVIQQAPAPAATVSLANVPEVAAPAPILNPVPASTSVVDPIVLPVFESSSVIPQLVPGASLPTAFSEPFGASQASIQQLVSSNELVRVATSVPTSFDTVIVTQTSTLPDGLLTVPTSADGSALANANGAIMREDSGRLSPAVEGVLITLGILCKFLMKLKLRMPIANQYLMLITSRDWLRNLRYGPVSQQAQASRRPILVAISQYPVDQHDCALCCRGFKAYHCLDRSHATKGGGHSASTAVS